MLDVHAENNSTTQQESGSNQDYNTTDLRPRRERIRKER
jgi:hypothetical protein